MKQLGKVKLTDEITETIDIDNLSTDISAVNENVNRLSNDVNSELTLLKDEIQTALDNKVDKNTSIITIGEKSSIQNNGINCIGIGYNTGSPNEYSENNVVIGQNCAVYNQGSTSIVIGTNSNITAPTKNYSNIAIGNRAYVTANINHACQLGSGTNNVANSLQYISTPIVVDGKIPTSSLELKTTIINALSDIQNITSFDASAIQTIVTALSNLYSAINS